MLDGSSVPGRGEPMSHSRRRKCRNCRELFRADPRNLRHQRYCAKPQCRRASKAASQQRWLAKAANRDYFHGPAHGQRVRAWRAAHPGYWRQRGRALQEHSVTQGAEPQRESGLLADSPLQELSRAQPLILIGLIAQLTGTALQEDIAHTARRLQHLAQDILNPSPERVPREPAP